MKKCRHSGTENEDSRVVCAECGILFSPSPVRVFWARLPAIAVKYCARLPSIAAKLSWLRPVVGAFALFFVVLAVYLLALGPILRFYGVRPSSGWSRLPVFVRTIYDPVDRLPIRGPISRMLQSYNRWWMRASSEKADFIRAMEQLDRSITIGTSQSDLVQALGQPIFWETNEGNLVARYSWPPPVVDFHAITDGFWITFSNGVVVRKDPVVTLSN